MSDQGAMRDHWYPVGMTKQVTSGGRDTLLLGEPIRVFLDNGANTALDDRVLDAEMNQDGSVRFAIASQS